MRKEIINIQQLKHPKEQQEEKIWIQTKSNQQLLWLKIETSINSLSKTPENFQLAFDMVKNINWVERNILYRYIIDVFIFSNWMKITEQKWTRNNLKILSDNTDKSNEYQKIIDANLSKDDYKNLLLFDITLKDWVVAFSAEDIARKYKLEMTYSDEKSKQRLIWYINDEKEMTYEEKLVLLEYINRWYKLIEKDTNNFVKKVIWKMQENSKTMCEMIPWIDFSDYENCTYFSRNPDKLGQELLEHSPDEKTLHSNVDFLLKNVYQIIANDNESSRYISKLYTKLLKSLEKNSQFSSVTRNDIQDENGNDFERLSKENYNQVDIDKYLNELYKNSQATLWNNNDDNWKDWNNKQKQIDLMWINVLNEEEIKFIISLILSYNPKKSLLSKEKDIFVILDKQFNEIISEWLKNKLKWLYNKIETSLNSQWFIDKLITIENAINIDERWKKIFWKIEFINIQKDKSIEEIDIIIQNKEKEQWIISEKSANLKALQEIKNKLDLYKKNNENETKEGNNQKKKDNPKWEKLSKWNNFIRNNRERVYWDNQDQVMTKDEIERQLNYWKKIVIWIVNYKVSWYNWEILNKKQKFTLNKKYDTYQLKMDGFSMINDPKLYFNHLPSNDELSQKMNELTIKNIKWLKWYYIDFDLIINN